MVSVAIILWSSTGKNSFSYTRVNIGETDPMNCEVKETAAKDTCYNIVAVNTKNLSMCDRIEGAWQKDICYSGVRKKITGQNMENP